MKKAIFSLWIMLFPAFIFSQHLEIGVSLGGGNYLGELSANSSTIMLSETNFAYGAFLRYNINPFIALRLQGNYTSLSGADTNASDIRIKNRNLSFSTNIYEGALVGEFNILGLDLSEDYFSPYIFGGIAYYGFNPKTMLNGQTYELQPLSTEGQGLEEYPDRAPYKLRQFAIPFGLGVKYALSEKIHLGLELGVRKLFTDYLDDISLTYPNLEFYNTNNPLEAIASQLSDRSLSPEPQTGLGRGDISITDWYFITNFTFSFNFLGSDNSSRKRSRKNKYMGCPTF